MSSGAAALLVLLAAAARAGIVATNPRTFVADRLCSLFFATSKRCLVSFCKSNATATLSPPSLKQLLFDGRGNLHLEVEQISDGLSVDAVEHVLKQVERFALVFHQRILLAVSAKPDAFL